MGLDAIQSVAVTESKAKHLDQLDVDLSHFKQEGFNAMQTAQAFQQSAAFKPYSQSLEALLKEWVDLLSGSANQHEARNAFNLLLYRMGVEVPGYPIVERTHFGLHLGLMYTLGTQLIKDIDRVISHCKSLPQPDRERALSWCQSSIQNIAQGIQKCAPACIDNIRQQTLRLTGLVFPQNVKSQVQAMMHHMLLHMATLFVNQHAKPFWFHLTGNNQFFENNEIHLVNGLYNAVCSRVALPEIQDEYAGAHQRDWEKSPLFAQFALEVDQAMTPGDVAKRMAENLLDQISGHLTENPSANFPKLKDEIDLALCQTQGEGHGFDTTGLITSNSDYTEFFLTRVTTLLELHFLYAIHGSDLLVYFPNPEVLIPDLGAAPPRRIAVLNGLHFVESTEKTEPGLQALKQILTVEHLELPGVENYLQDGQGNVFELVWEAFANSSVEQIQEYLQANPDFAPIAPQRIHLLKRAKLHPCLQNILRLECHLHAAETGVANRLGQLTPEEYNTGSKGPGDDYWTLETLRDWSCSEFFKSYSPEEQWCFSLLPARMRLSTFSLLKWVAIYPNPYLMDCVKNVDFFGRLVRDMDRQMLIQPQPEHELVNDLFTLLDYISMGGVEHLGWLLVIKKLADRHYPRVAQILGDVNYSVDYIVSTQIIEAKFSLVRALHQLINLNTALGPLTWAAVAQSPHKDWFQSEFAKLGLHIPTGQATHQF